MEIKVGDYVRFDGEIAKIRDIKRYKTKEDIYVFDRILDLNEDRACNDNTIYNSQWKYFDNVKSSPNIIDLIEVGDYVNGLPVERVGRTLDDENDIRVWFGVATYGRTTLNQINHRYTVKDDFEDDYSLRFRCIKPEDIKSIVTREQFLQMEYKIND